MEDNILSFSFLIAAFGQIILVLSLLTLRMTSIAIYFPLALFFLSSGLSFTFPAINTIWPEFALYSIFILLPCIGIQPVALWLYVVGLTSPSPWRFNKTYWRHFIPAFGGLLLSLMFLCVPQGLVYTIFIEGKDPNNDLGLFIMVTFLVLILVYLIQATVYLAKVVKRLLRYQSQLKQLFSSNEHRELVWVLWLVFIISVNWLATLIYFLPTLASNSPLFGDEIITACYFVLIWTLATWGLRQKPGFHGRYLTDKNHELTQIIEKVDSNSQKKKYQRSALGEQQSKSIATKLARAMSEQLYLQADLSLPSLAQHIKVPANYLSQTLNERLNESFFDYINRFRIEHAKHLLTQGNNTILTVAMDSGFNAKSSFYKAFKKNTGQTPSQFIKNL